MLTAMPQGLREQFLIASNRHPLEYYAQASAVLTPAQLLWHHSIPIVVPFGGGERPEKEFPGKYGHAQRFQPFFRSSNSLE
jgi:hypothetical protein